MGLSTGWGSPGSVLGPLLFLIYINDITEEVQSSEIRLFADDTILYILVDNPVQSAAALNDDLNRISRWAAKWIVCFSAPKTKAMFISKKNKQNPNRPLMMNNVILEEVKEYKHLGVTITSDLTWNKHIENMATSAGKCLDVLNALKYRLDRASLEKIYKAYIRSKLEYASIVWDSCTKHLSDLLEAVQYRAAKIISGAISRTSHNAVYKELNWLTLEERRERQRLRVLYKCIHGQAPAYLQNVTYPQREGNPRYVLRNQKLPNYRSRTSTFHNSFIPKTVRDWNSLPNETKSAGTLEAFTNNLDSDLRCTPKWF